MEDLTILYFHQNIFLILSYLQSIIHIFLYLAGPKPVEFVNVTALSDTTAIVSWTTSNDQVDHYVIVIEHISEKRTTNVAANETFTIINGLQQQTAYGVKVFAVRNGVQSTASSVTLSFVTLADGKIINIFFSNFNFLILLSLL